MINQPVHRFSGSFTALITPFRDSGIDVDGLKQNIAYQLAHGTAGLVPCGTTGEAPTLSQEEWEVVVTTTVAAADKKVPVIVGTGTNDTRKTIAHTRRAEELGADGALVVSPYYNKPTQQGIYRHFRAVAESVGLAIVIYNIPGRTGVNIMPETIAKLAADCPNIAAVKEASGNIDQTSEIVQRCGDRLTILSGDDSLTLPLIAVGAKGVISVVSNIVPQDVAALCAHALAGEMAEAQRLHHRLFSLTKTMFIQTNPIPVKTAMNLLGMPAGPLRLPLCEPSAEHHQTIVAALRQYGLLS